MHEPDFFYDVLEQEIKLLPVPEAPVQLYEPIRYMLSLPAKRLRPVLLLMSSELFGGDYRNALKPALGIEVFHNFTLLHDDIMDKAPLRRSKETVHKKWNSDIAILSGDAMFVKSCELMMQVPENNVKPVLGLFYKTAIEVCEGQQYDMNYESEANVTIDQYLSMIRLKTAALIGCALQAGAMIAGASDTDFNLLYDFGINTGIAFQLHDDILDIYGDESKFGKRTGGDIIANKKTFLLLKAYEQASSSTRSELNKWMMDTSADPDAKVKAVKDIFSLLRIRELAELRMEEYFQQALRSLEKVMVPEEKKQPLLNFTGKLMLREA